MQQRRTAYVMTLASGLALVLAGVSMGQGRPGGPGSDPNERQALLEQFDADGDGKLSDTERRALGDYMKTRSQPGCLSRPVRIAEDAEDNGAVVVAAEAVNCFVSCRPPTT